VSRASKKVRDMAATLASAGACSGENQFGVFEAFKSPDWHDALALLWQAYKVADVDYDDGTAERHRQLWAEAEAMLRTGWAP
jgi:hypothetical protein